MSAANDLQAPPPSDRKVWWTRLALIVSFIGVAGSLYLSAGMGLKACPLCFYQRAFLMAAASVLLFGLFFTEVPVAALTLLALTPAVAGAGVAAFHTYLDARGILECPLGVTGMLTAPQESVLLFTILLGLLLGDLFYQGRYVPAGLCAVVLGGVVAVVCLNPAVTPAPPSPAVPYTTPVDGCRKPYQPPTSP